MELKELLAEFKAGKCPPVAALKTTDGTATASEVGKPDDKTLKVHLKALNKGGMTHWYWGRIVHDFGTAKLPTKVALDDTHGDEIGYARPMLTEYGLELEGVVIPNADNPQHESNRIAYNLRNNIPQQASIDWSGEYDLLEIPEKFTVQINGLPVTGPALAVQNWSLRACAICKEGADPTTETTVQTFSADAAGIAQAPHKITTVAQQQAVEAVDNPPPAEAAAETPPESNTTPPPSAEAAAVPPAPAVESEPAQPTQPENPLAATVASLTAENADLKTKLAASQAETVAANGIVTELRERITQLAGGVPPVQASQPGSGKTLWQQYAEISDLAEKTRFYRAHKAEMSKNPNA